MTTPGKLNELSAAEELARELVADRGAERMRRPAGRNEDDLIDETTP